MDRKGTYNCLLLRMIPMIHILPQLLVSQVEVDQRHLQMYPYCGRNLKLGQTTTSSARIVNSKDAKWEYPWVVLVERINMRKINLRTPLNCMGSVITER